MKNSKFFLFFILFIFIIPSNVFAVSKNFSCADFRNKVNEYNGYNDQLNSLGCYQSDLTDAVTINECNSLLMQRNSALQDVFYMNDNKSNCNIDDLQSIINENGSSCSSSISSDIKDFASNVMSFFYMIAPLLLIIFGSVDFFKIIVNGDPKTKKRNITNFFKRLTAFILLYFTPFIVKQLSSLTTTDLTGNRYICSTDIINVSGNSTRVVYSGIYGIDNSLSGSGNEILKAADSISKSWANQDFDYSTTALVSYNIKESINNPAKATCCATLVAAALYKSKAVPEAEINSIQYNGAKYIAELLDKRGWAIIESYDKLQPGDIVFMVTDSNATVNMSNGKNYLEGHVQIYAGGNKWYNAGSPGAIKGPQPSIQDGSYVKPRFSFAMRVPFSKTQNSSSNTRSSSRTNTNSASTQQNTNTNSTSTQQNTNTNSNKQTNTKETTPSSNTSNTNKQTNTKETAPSSNTSNTNTNKKTNTKETTSNKKK